MVKKHRTQGHRAREVTDLGPMCRVHRALLRKLGINSLEKEEAPLSWNNGSRSSTRARTVAELIAEDEPQLPG